MKILSHLVGAAVVAAVLVGCGGGGGSSTGGGTTTRLTKQQVLDLFQNGLKNSGNVIDNTGQGAGPQSRSVKAHRFSRAAVHGSKLKSGGLTRDHENGGSPTFDEFSGLWVQSVEPVIDENGFAAPNSPSGYRFFEDHEMTKPAGHDLIWITHADPENGNGEFGGKWDLSYTAGNFAGESHNEEWHFSAGEGSGSISGSGTTPGYGSYEFSGNWGGDGFGTWTQKYTYEDGTWQSYAYTDREDFSSQLVIDSSKGVKFTLDFATDGSGSGTMTGNGEGLPATIVWTVEGPGTITWADGSTTKIDIYDLIYEQGSF